MKSSKNEYQQDVINSIQRNIKASLDEFSVTVQLANTLVENALKAIHRDDWETRKEDLNPQEIMSWNEYTDKVTQILNQFGKDLQEILNQKLGQEVAQEFWEKVKAKIIGIKEKR